LDLYKFVKYARHLNAKMGTLILLKNG